MRDSCEIQGKLRGNWLRHLFEYTNQSHVSYTRRNRYIAESACYRPIYPIVEVLIEVSKIEVLKRISFEKVIKNQKKNFKKKNQINCPISTPLHCPQIRCEHGKVDCEVAREVVGQVCY